jgi:hypothetical protein
LSNRIFRSKPRKQDKVSGISKIVFQMAQNPSGLGSVALISSTTEYALLILQDEMMHGSSRRLHGAPERE